jgi:dihydroorotate dehydrogenase electron transfer subunit
MNQPGEFSCKVSGQVNLATHYYLIELEASVLARSATPGQFAMLRCGEGHDPFLRRPLGIHQVNKQLGRISFLYKVRGKGTSWLSQRKSGDPVSLLGPLGRGFNCSEPGSKGLVVGAGVGVAPLLFLASELADRGWELIILMGGRSESGILRPDAFMEYKKPLCTYFRLTKRSLEPSSCPLASLTGLDLKGYAVIKFLFQRLSPCLPHLLLAGLH